LLACPAGVPVGELGHDAVHTSPPPDRNRTTDQQVGPWLTWGADVVTEDEALAWITSHSFRKTAATILDEAALSARLVADQLGHSRPSMTQDIYLAAARWARRRRWRWMPR
jgi:integrase